MLTTPIDTDVYYISFWGYMQGKWLGNGDWWLVVSDWFGKAGAVKNRTYKGFQSKVGIRGLFLQVFECRPCSCQFICEFNGLGFSIFDVADEFAFVDTDMVKPDINLL